MQRTVALRERGRLAVLLASILQQARHTPVWHDPDRRNLRAWRQLILAVLVQRSTRLLTLARALLPPRKAHTVKALAVSLGYFLRTAQCPVATLSPCLLAAALQRLDARHLVRVQGKALLVLDPTEYPKRGRGQGKRDRHMQHLGRVRNAKGKRSGTQAGYVDVWAGVVLRGKRFLPLARRLFSSTHPDVASQNQVEEAVLAAALQTVDHLGLDAIIVADRGLGRKALLIQLAQQERDFVIRLDADITARHVRTGWEGELAALLAQQPWLGEVVWDRGEAGKLVCRARKVRAEISYTTGRKAATIRAWMTFLELAPVDGQHDPLVLATSFWVRTRTDAQGVAHIYSQRWAIETAFETMKAWGLEQFMVRQWDAIERLLWIVAVAYALATLALYLRALARFRAQAYGVLQRWSAVKRWLTVGKVAEALGYDYHHHPRAWTRVWIQ
jgi:hypothetical protein